MIAEELDGADKGRAKSDHDSILDPALEEPRRFPSRVSKGRSYRDRNDVQFWAIDKV